MSAVINANYGPIPGFNKNFKSYLHSKTKTIFWIICIVCLLLTASLITLGILYDRDIKNKSTEDKNLGLASLIILAVGIFLLLVMIWLSWSSWKNALIEDAIVSDLTIVASEKPALTQLQDKIGSLVHNKLNNNKIDREKLTNYIFGRADKDTGIVPTELRDSAGKLIAAQSGLLPNRPANQEYTKENVDQERVKAYQLGYQEGKKKG